MAVSLFPTGSVSFADVTLGDDAAEPALTADRLTARLRFFPLLIGRIEIADVSLMRPRIIVTFEPDGRSNWSGLIGDAGARARARSANRPADATSFSEIRMSDGTIAITERCARHRRRASERRAGAGLAVDLASFAATGRFVWRGEPVDASAHADRFRRRAGRRPLGPEGPARRRAAQARLRRQLEPAADAEDRRHARGRRPSLRDTLRWAGMQPLPGGGFGRFALKAKTNVSGGTIALSGVNVELDGNVAEGVLAFATDGRADAARARSPPTSSISRPICPPSGCSPPTSATGAAAAIALDGLADFDLDLRLSAARITVGDAPSSGAPAIAANLRGGKPHRDDRRGAGVRRRR